MRASRLENAVLIVLCAFLYPWYAAHAKSQVLGSTKRVLVIPQLTRVGDLVVATPIFRAIKGRYPDAHLTVLVSKKAVGIIRSNPRIDEIIPIEDYSFFALARKFRQERYDAAFSLAGVSTATLLMLASYIPLRVKTARADAPLSERLTDWMATHHPVYEHQTFLPDYYARMLRLFDIHDANIVPEVFPTEAGRQKAAQFFAHEKAPYVGISITAGNKIKEWGDERFALLARELHAHYDVTLVFLGGPNDYERTAKVVEKIGVGSNVVATEFSLDELPAVIERLALFVAVDTGPIYIAYALGIPLINIIGPVDPNEQQPNDEKSIRVLPEGGIAPSSFVFKRAGKPEEHARAVASIPVSKVLEAVALLASRGYGVGKHE